MAVIIVYNSTLIFLPVSFHTIDPCTWYMLTVPVEWVSGDLNAVAQWDFGTTDGIAYHKVWKQNQQHFTEVYDRAEWGKIVCMHVLTLDIILTTAVLRN